MLRKWDVDLDGAEEQTLYQQYFVPAWKRHEIDGKINISQSVDLMRDYLGSVTAKRPKEKNEEA